MIKSLCAIALATLCGVAHAEQMVLVNRSPDKGVAQYLDIDNVMRNGDLVEMSRIFDHKASHVRKVNNKLYTSQRVRTEFDCESMALRQLRSSWHTEPMGNGETLEENNEPELWEFGNNDHFTYPLWKIACGR